MGPDASNACLPVSSPVVVSIPPTPSTERGERCTLDGRTGRLSANKGVMAYTSGKSVVVRNILPKTGIASLTSSPDTCYADIPALLDNQSDGNNKLPVLVYRGHNYAATSCKLAPSGCYCASGDERGCLRVWAFDHEDHLAKYETNILSGPIRDLGWDGESKRIAIIGERAPDAAGADCCKAIQWDTGVTVGQLAQHMKGRAAAVAVKPNRPFRIVTAGKEDHKTYFHKGPPFSKIPPSGDGIPEENAHTKGGVHCIRYQTSGEIAVSVGTDRSICTYEGKTLKLLDKLEQVHNATIYSCAWSSDDKTVLTASGDGTCKLFSVAQDGTGKLEHVQTWHPAQAQYGGTFDKVPVGGNQVGCTFVSQEDIPVSVGLNGQVSILPKKADSGEAIQVLTGHDAPIAGLAVDHANDVFYTGDTDGLLCQWKLSTGQPIQRLAPTAGKAPNADLMFVVHSGAISAVAVTSGAAGGKLLSVGWDDKLNTTTGKDGKLDPNAVPLGAQPSAMATGTNLAVICTVKGLLLYKGGKLSDMIPIDYTAQAACVKSDDKTVIVGGDDCKIHIYNVVNGMSLKETKVIDNGHLKPIHAFSLSNDETKLASADVRDVCVFDLANGDSYKALVAKGRWCFHVQRITCLTWSPDDSIIASGGADDSIYLWNLDKKMKRIHYPYAHRGGLTGLEFHKKTKDGGSLKLVSVGNDAVVNQWDVTKDVKEKFS